MASRDQPRVTGSYARRYASGMTWYFRLQPKGAPLTWTSTTSGGPRLAKGFVFAYRYDNPAEALEWWTVRDPREEMEVVLFSGRGDYDPGDVEGVVVKPKRIVRRVSPLKFIAGVMARDPENAAEWRKLLVWEQRRARSRKCKYGVRSAGCGAGVLCRKFPRRTRSR